VIFKLQGTEIRRKEVGMQVATKYFGFGNRSVPLLLIVGLSFGLARGQQVLVEPPRSPITVSVNSLGDIAISSGGNLLLEDGQIFRASQGVPPVWERVQKFEVSQQGDVDSGTVVLTYTPPIGAPVHFFMKAGTGNALAGPLSLATDSPGDISWRFVARVRWGTDPWLVQLGQTSWDAEPAERLSSLPTAARPTWGSMVSASSPGFVSQPNNPQFFQVASGAVDDRNSDTLYDQATDRALIFHGRHVELTPLQRENQSEYRVTAELHPGDQATQVPLAIAGRWFAERLDYQFLEKAPVPLPRIMLVVVPMARVINTQVPFFQPMSAEMRTNFPQAPSGWVPVYTTLPRFAGPEEHQRNAQYKKNWESMVIQGANWVAKNLPPDAYGVSVIEGFEHYGKNDKTLTGGRDTGGADWRSYNEEIYRHGPKWMSDQIHVLGLKAGTWLVPQAWMGADDLYKEHTDWFLHYPGGDPIRGDFWLNDYLIDASNPAARDFVARIMRKSAEEWGFDYFFLDGFWSDKMEGLYASATPYFHDPTLSGWEACRELLKSMRSAVGPARFMFLDGPIMTLGTGLANGSRSSADIGGFLNWKGAFTALTGTMDYYFLNRTGWYNNPSEVFLAGEPLTLDQARLWATMASLTGQFVMTGDAVWELTPERVNILKSVFPSPPVRPVELYSRHGEEPSIWDLRVDHVGHQWDVVMFANWEAQPRTISVSVADLGLDPQGSYAIFDFWEKKSLGTFSSGRVELLVPATGSRLIRLTPLTDHPELIGLTRHVSQGLVDLRALAWDGTSRVLRGESLVPGGDPYQVWVYLPEGYRLRSIKSSADHAECETATPRVQECTITSPNTTVAKWELQF
jgi:hypothetical protein